MRDPRWPGSLGAARPLAAATAVLYIRLYSPRIRASLRAVLAPKRRPRIEAGFSGVEEVEEPLMSWIYLQSSPAVVGPGAAFLWELSLGSAEIREWPPLPSLRRSL